MCCNHRGSSRRWYVSGLGVDFAGLTTGNVSGCVEAEDMEIQKELSVIPTKLTQQQFADKVGIKQSQLARLETGKQLLRLDTLAALAAGAGYQVEVIIKPRDTEGEELPEIQSLVLH